MLLRPLRSWAARALRREGLGSPGPGRGTRGVQRPAWPRGNASFFSISGGRRLALSGRRSHSPPSGLNPKLLLGAAILSRRLRGRGGARAVIVSCLGRQRAASGWGRGDPSREEKDPPTPRERGLLPSGSRSRSDSHGLGGDRGPGAAVNQSPAGGGCFSLGAFLLPLGVETSSVRNRNS